MRYVAAHQPIALKAKLTVGRVQKVKFEITDKTGKKVAESGEIPLAAEKAEWSWTPNTDAVKILPDEEDLIEVGCRVFWFNPDGSGSGGYVYLEDLTVFRDELKVKVLTEDDKAVVDANVRLVIERPGVLTRSQKLAADPANAQGEVSFDGIQQWTSIGVVVGGAWVLKDAAAPWKAGKDKGLNREVVVVAKKYKAAFKGIARAGSTTFDPVTEAGDTRIQYVNFKSDQAAPTPGPDETAANYCNSIQIRVGPETAPAGFAGDLIYVKFEADAGNSKRNDPKPGLTGQGKQPDAQGVLELRLDPQGLAVCNVELGYAGGDKFTIKICSIKDFSGTIDQILTIETWRKMFYELMAPNAITPALVAAGPHHDLPDNLRDWLKRVLDPVFVKYELSKSFIFRDDLTRPSQLQPSAFFERTEPRNLFIGSYFSRRPASVSFTSPREPHTIQMTFFDAYFSDVLDTRQAPVMNSLELDIAPSARGRFFLPNMRAINSNQADEEVVRGAITWEAVISNPATYENPSGQLSRFRHPGLDHSGRPLTGRLNPTCIRAVTQRRVTLTLPNASATDPGALVGAESDTKCPIKVTLTLMEATVSGGGYAKGAYIAYFHPRIDISAFLFGHELGHAMNMTIMKAADVPPGLTAPKHVDEGGTYYRNAKGSDVVGQGGVRTPGVGEHCATGLDNKAAPDYPTDPPASGCIMFGYAPSTTSAARTEPLLFCSVCTEYVKAQDLSKTY